MSQNRMDLFAEFNTDGRWWFLRLFVAAADGKTGVRIIRALQSRLMTKVVTVTECLRHYAKGVKSFAESAQLEDLFSLMRTCEAKLVQSSIPPWTQLWDVSRPLCRVSRTRHLKLSITDFFIHLKPRLNRLLELLHSPGAGHEVGRFRKDNICTAHTCDIVESDARQLDSSGQAATEEVAAGAPIEYEYQQCLQCGEVCTEPFADETLYCSLCIRPVHAHCRQLWQESSHTDATIPDFHRRIWCSHQCKSTFTDMQALINQTVKEGCIRLPSPFPPNLGISVTAGHHKTQPSHTKTIIPAARKLLHAFSDAYRELDMPDSPRVRLVGAFVQCTHPVWHWNTAYTIVLWVGVPAEGPIDLKKCTPVNSIIVRLQGEYVADLLYTATASRFQNCKLLNIVMLWLQLQFAKMGVQNIFLDAANETAHKVWTAPTLGFHMITEAQFNVVRAKWTLVHNSDVFSRLWKVVPEGDALLQQVQEQAPLVHERLQAKQAEAVYQADEKRKAVLQSSGSPKRCRRARKQLDL